jgi:UPF0755 protein
MTPKQKDLEELFWKKFNSSMKKLLLIPLLGAVLFAGSIFWFYQNFQAVNSSTKELQDFVIDKGSSASKVGNKLKANGLIRSPLAFKIYVTVSGKAGGILAGEYRLSPSFNLFQIISQFQKGPLELWVTIPEGLRREEIAQKFAKVLDKDQSFVDVFMVSSKGNEGYLFPETYLFPKEASASSIVARMKKTFDSKTSSLGPTKSQVILASLVERESRGADERAVIAGILLNRINIGMPLQVDATVQYVIGTSNNWWPVPTRDDLKVSSNYNTYKFAGLPPSPISIPGLSSIEAAVNPKKSEYLYYLHDSKGTVHYARTLEEQNSNIRIYLGR